MHEYVISLFAYSIFITMCLSLLGAGDIKREQHQPSNFSFLECQCQMSWFNISLFIQFAYGLYLLLQLR